MIVIFIIFGIIEGFIIFSFFIFFSKNKKTNKFKKRKQSQSQSQQIQVRFQNLQKNKIDKKKAIKIVKEYFFKWSVKEKWNPALYDYDIFYELWPDGFYYRELYDEKKKEYKIVSILFAPRDDEGKKASFGGYICDNEYRGKGNGLSLWKYVQKPLKNHNIWLCAVPQQKENYEKFGFVERCKIIRLTMVKPVNRKTSDKNVMSFKEASETERIKVLEFVGKKYNKHFVKFIKLLLKREKTMAVFYKNGDGKIIGFGLSKPVFNPGSYVYYFLTDKENNFEVINELFLKLNTQEYVKTILIHISENSKVGNFFVDKWQSKTEFIGFSMTTKPDYKKIDIFPNLDTVHFM